jgi:hypothetical protein
MCFIIGAMNAPQRDIAAIRLDNALLLFDEFVRQAARNPDAATLRGLEGRFAEKLGIQPSYWSQLKSRSRQIGERLARQFELLSHKPRGWLDEPHTPAPVFQSAHLSEASAPGTAADPVPVPQTDEERLIVGWVLTYYRTHPQQARARLLALLGEVLGAAGAAPAAPPAADDEHALWARSQRGVAPLKRKR